MRHVINILLLGMVLLGIAMMTDTPWGLGVALAPFVVWGARFLSWVHRTTWACAIFWAVVACFSWQAAIVILAAFIVVQSLKTLSKEGLANRRIKPREKNDELHLYLDPLSMGGLGIGPGTGDD
ncbi:Uncharacterised protein [Escherichia coli]|nr:Uncharacterised protein [Escherichia coli]